MECPVAPRTDPLHSAHTDTQTNTHTHMDNTATKNKQHSHGQCTDALMAAKVTANSCCVSRPTAYVMISQSAQ